MTTNSQALITTLNRIGVRCSSCMKKSIQMLTTPAARENYFKRLNLTKEQIAELEDSLKKDGTS